MNKLEQPDASSHWQTTLETNSGPLSLRMYFGTPGVRNNHSKASIAAGAGIDGATMMARHSRVYSSIMARILSLLPLSVLSSTKSQLQTWFGHPAFDRTAGWQLAFAKDLDAFAKRLLERAGPYPQQVERMIELRRRGMSAPNPYAARAEARQWQEEQAQAADG